jgi:hypothetical protein
MNRFILNILFFFVGFFFAFLFFELLPDNLVRGGVGERAYCRWDPITAFRFIPGEFMSSKLFDFRSHIKIGKEGFRCTLPLDKASDAPVRIIILGHSQPFSAGCDEPDSLHQRLVQTLSDKYHIKSVCYNFSLPHAKILDQLAVIKKYGPVLHPTHVFFWGREKDTEEDLKQRIKMFRDRIIYGYNFEVVPCMKKRRLLKYSCLVRCLSSATLWTSLSEKRHIPRAFYDLAHSLGLIETKAVHAKPVKDLVENTTVSSKEYSPKDIAKYCSSLGANFMMSIWPPDPSLVYPTDGHMTPAGIQQLADGLAEKIAGSIQ